MSESDIIVDRHEIDDMELKYENVWKNSYMGFSCGHIVSTQAPRFFSYSGRGDVVEEIEHDIKPWLQTSIAAWHVRKSSADNRSI